VVLTDAKRDEVNTYIALVRGIGGKNTLPMRAFVQLLEEMGLGNVRTYIQSGNAIFQSRTMGASTLSDRIKTAIAKSYGFAPHVIILTPDELGHAVALNPYPKAESEPNTLHLTFLASVPKNPDLITLKHIKRASERFTLKGKVFYLHAPEGVGRSKLFARIEKSLGVSGTARNWRSVCNIKAMAEQMV
jgi:uncharacterized protein (DUF1697 family)